ncbi:hypothetical protein N9Y00_10975 [Tateyamaria sp.]|nr:hypothetical protein [Tateyamaria sp.]
MPRNPWADQIGTGGRIKSESAGGSPRNAQMPAQTILKMGVARVQLQFK